MISVRCFVLLLCLTLPAWAGEGALPQKFRLANDQVGLTVTLEGDMLATDRFGGSETWLARFGSRPFALVTDAGFGLDVAYTGWRAPGKLHNADNPVLLDADDFIITQVDHEPDADGGGALHLNLESLETRLQVRLTYRLDAEGFWLRRRIAVRDPEDRGHFLRRAWPLRASIGGNADVLKPGGFGDPAVVALGDGAVFFGLEYPAAVNAAVANPGSGIEIRTGKEVGQRIGTEWLASEWAVVGLSPDARVKRWFERYLDDIRVAPLTPYALYNTWYDVRSPEYTERAEDVMNEANLRRIIADFQRVIQRHPELRLDAFVLDDGWDVYASDWALREAEFPGGLRPVAAALEPLGADLGIWFGPTGGYSFRDKRIDWMRDHGYERVGNQMCVAGTRYHDLLVRRTVDLVRDHDVSYFKWDGIQFSCSEPDHGHLPGLYSRAAVMDSVIAMSEAVREENPDVFLNITSGTWMSPWWLKYANTIWMQGYDYGYSDVPSISKRDRAITYRDVVLHENYGVNDLWFPISGLMTHGIIKGHLQKLGGEAESLDKFTDNAVLYFARGVAQWELYVSPNLLSADEWNAIAAAMAWARDRFDVLMTTEMIGGDPGANEPYGYAHFDGERGVVAARNPFVVPGGLDVELSPLHGLAADAESLVLERVYPTRWISPRLYRAGETLELSLQGYETAIYELYPLESASEPLLAGVVFEDGPAQGKAKALRVLQTGETVRFLDPGAVKKLTVAGRKAPVAQMALPAVGEQDGVVGVAARPIQNGLEVEFELAPEVTATLAILVRPEQKSEGEDDPEVSVRLDGAVAETHDEVQAGTWSWRLADAGPGRHRAQVSLTGADGAPAWSGSVEAWLLLARRPEPVEIGVVASRPSTAARPLPPCPWPAGELRSTLELGRTEVALPAAGSRSSADATE